MSNLVYRCIAVIALSSTSAPAIAQIETVAGAATTGAMITGIRQELSTLLSEATAKGDFLAQRASQEGLYLIDAFERANSNLIDKAFDRIGEERQAVLNQIRETTNEIQKGRIDTLLKLENTTDQIDRLSREVTFKNYPVIYRYRGSIVTPGETTNVRLKVSGANLILGTPHIIFRDKKYNALKDGENLLFELPRSMFTAEKDKMKSEVAKLNLVRKHGGFLGMFQQTGETSYDLNIVTLPSNLAEVSIAYKTSVPSAKERSFSDEVAYNSSSRGWNCRDFAYSPASADRRFDLDRSSVTQGSGNSRGQLRDVNVRDVGISFRICAKRRWHDSNNGFRHAIVRYVEKWTTSSDEERSERAALLWTSDAVFKLPDQVNNLLITVRDFTGKESILTAAGGYGGRYSQVSYDAQSDAVVVRPQIPADLNSL